LSQKRELVARVEECSYCDLSSENLCDRHQGILDSLPSEYVVRCMGCGEIFTEVPEKCKVECHNCDKILKCNRGENQQ
jgi:hypothetical protein